MTLREDLQELKADVKELRDIVVLIRLDLATLKVKASLWGGVAGMVVGLSALLYGMLVK